VQESLDWSEFALLVVDMQRDFWAQKVAEQFPAFPERVMQLLALSRRQGIDVIHLRAGFRPDMSDWMVRYVLRERIPCVEGTRGAETLPFALERPSEPVFVKHSFDGFLNPALLPHLLQRGKRFVLVGGLVTSVCVLLTAAAASQLGFLVAVVEDCCADDALAHQQTLDRYQFIFDRVTVDSIPATHGAWRESLQLLERRMQSGPMR
jgi:ureidoacrylate peracid hydrolase